MTREVVLKILAQNDVYRRVVGDTERRTTGLGDNVERVGSKIKTRIAAAFGTAAILKFGKDSFKAFNESVAANDRLQNTLKNNPKLVGESTDSFTRLATAIQAKTLADDESVIAGQAVLGNFDLTCKQIRDTVPLLVDYARKTGREVPQAAGVLGKALMGNTRALKELGINYKPTGDRAKDFAAITDLLRSKVGGFAEKEGRSAQGRVVQLGNRMNDMQEQIGAKLAPAIAFLSTHFELLMQILIPLIAAFISYKTWAGIIQIANTLLGKSFSTALGPIGLVILALVAIGTAAYMFRDKLRAALAVVVDKFLWFVGIFIHGAAKAFGWIPGIGPKLRRAAERFDRFREDVNKSLRGITDPPPVNIVAKLQLQYKDVPVGRRGIVVKAESLPGRAAGGPTHPYQDYLVGEEGPEVLRMGASGGQVIPFAPRRAPSGGGVNATINLYGGGASPAKIIEELDWYARTKGA